MESRASRRKRKIHSEINVSGVLAASVALAVAGMAFWYLPFGDLGPLLDLVKIVHRYHLLAVVFFLPISAWVKTEESLNASKTVVRLLFSVWVIVLLTLANFEVAKEKGLFLGFLFLSGYLEAYLDNFDLSLSNKITAFAQSLRAVAYAQFFVAICARLLIAGLFSS